MVVGGGGGRWGWGGEIDSHGFADSPLYEDRYSPHSLLFQTHNFVPTSRFMRLFVSLLNV